MTPVGKTAPVDEVRYARTAEGIQIAFRVLPGGPGEPLVYLPGLVYSIESILEDAPYARFIDGLTELGPVILVERQGIAASDPLDPANDFYEQWVTNVIAVLDVLAIERAPIIGYCVSANIALEAALRHPDRVTAVVAFHAILALAPEVLAGLHERNQKVVARDDTAQADAWEQSAPSRVAEPAFTDWFRRAGRMAASPSAAAQLWDRVLRVTDIEARAREIQSPVLMITRRGFAEATGTSLETLQEFVDDMVDGTLVVLEGGDLIPNAGDIDGLLFEIAEFLHGGTHTASASRPVTTILFTDLVGSTAAARAKGDADWRAVLDHHDHLIERTVRRHGGTLVKTTGDGALTTFGAPSRALRCALALRDAMADLDIGVRMGLHLGEVEGRGTDVAGVAVHLAARVMAAADDGEILTTAALPLATLGGGFTFESRGAEALKGFDDAFELFRLIGKV